MTGDATAADGGADVTADEVQLKPWGNERIFADGAHGYVGKIITVDGGQSLSLQVHAAKDETMHVLHGSGRLEHGPDADHLAVLLLAPGDTVHLAPGTVHRCTAVTPLVLVETSTAAPGWREDITRLADSYGRAGTTAP
ncbi:cupin domain-containing protein [Serinibacter arcticus]|uniref:Cupin 2, conserved barrel domain protein n=1 Tax=Serinibacter arcticus TaxID=1655435 RepID=A0A4Z1E6X3_9MICO|nr:cupin [Serinibacter arcticus]TGO05437.1 Cupin 2, conserved barrel domain protein [Serinibacter arcticus]